MTVSVQSSESIFLGNGITPTWSFPWQYESADTIEVSYTDGSGQQTILTPTQYVLVLNPPGIGELWGTGGSVTYPTMGSPIANGTSLTVRRTVPFSQPTEVNNQTSYPIAVETALDNLEFQIQQIATRTGQFRGTWATDIYYNFGDIVLDGANGADTGNYYMCVIANTSGVWATDLADGDWTLAISVQGTTNINADDITAGVLSSQHGGAGTVNGILKANGAGVVSQAIANVDYQTPIILTTTGTSGAATFNGTTLNVPQYSSSPGSGTVTSVTFTGDGTILSATPSAAVTTSGTVTATLANATAKSLLGNATSGSATPTYLTSPVVSGSMTAASLIPTGAGVPVNGLFLPSAGAVGIANNSIPAAYFTGSGTGADAVLFSSQSIGNGPIIGVSSTGTNSPLILTSKGSGSVLIYATGTGTLLATFASTGAGTLNVSGATFTAGSFTANSSTPPVNGLYLPSANTPGIASNSHLVATFNSPGAGGDFWTFANVASSGISAVTAPTAPTAALAGGGAGNLSAGNYSYRITYAGTVGETTLGTTSNAITVVAPGTNGKMALTAIPVSGSGTVTARNIYRTMSGGSVYFFLHQIADNSTTIYTDNIADTALGWSGPTSQAQIPTYMIVAPAASGGDTSIGIQFKTLGTTTTGLQFNGQGRSGFGDTNTTGTFDFMPGGVMACRITDTYWNPNQAYLGTCDGGVVISSGSSTGGIETSGCIGAEIFNTATATSATLRVFAKGAAGQIHFITNGYVSATVTPGSNPNGNNNYADSYWIDLNGVAQTVGATPSISLQSSTGTWGDSPNFLMYHANTGDFIWASDNTNTAMFRMYRAASAVNQLYALPSATGGTSFLGAGGNSVFATGDANAPLGLTAAGTGAVSIFNGAGTNRIARFSASATSVNYLLFAAAVTSGNPAISAQGSDATVGLDIYTSGTGNISFKTNNTANTILALQNNGNAVFNTAALATSATAGFPWIPSCPGKPTGSATAPYNNATALVFDSTNQRLYQRCGGVWYTPVGSQTGTGAIGTLTLTANITYLTIGTSGGVASFALPAASIAGRAVVLIDYQGNAGSNNITTTVASAGTINGASSLVTNANYSIVTFIDNGTSWNA